MTQTILLYSKKIEVGKSNTLSKMNEIGTDCGLVPGCIYITKYFMRSSWFSHVPHITTS